MAFDGYDDAGNSNINGNSNVPFMWFIFTLGMALGTAIEYLILH